MSGKVKITQEQADAIEKESTCTEIVILVKCHIKGWEYGNNKCLNELSLDKFLRALYIGYEVEPEINDGDYLSHIYTYDIGEVNGGVVHWNSGFENDVEYINKLMISGEIRHATPEEIAKEKERRWWARHGREPWELKEDDILYYDKYIFAVVEVTELYVKLYSGGEYSLVNWSTIKSKYAVACFSHDRKDVDHE